MLTLYTITTTTTIKDKNKSFYCLTLSYCFVVSQTIPATYLTSPLQSISYTALEQSLFCFCFCWWCGYCLYCCCCCCYYYYSLISNTFKDYQTNSGAHTRIHSTPLHFASLYSTPHYTHTQLLYTALFSEPDTPWEMNSSTLFK